MRRVMHRNEMASPSTMGHGHELPASMTANPPFVSIAVPTLNEEHYIGACLTSLIGQWPEDAYEILVIDGGSTDGTAQIVATFSQRHRMVTLISNPARVQSAAMNLAAQLAAPQATILLRADAHALYAQDFVSRCVVALLVTGATSVVVPMHTQARPDAFLQQSIAAAQSSRFGNGGAAHRVNAVSGFVEHGHHAAFDRRFFRSIGGYDEGFTHNEDAELDVRAIAAGGRIWMCAEAPVIYYPRDRLDRLAQQYFRHGGGRARTLRKHRLKPRPRQLVPVAALVGCTASLAAAPFIPMVASLALLYPAICLAWGMQLAVARRDPRLLAGGLALMTIHLFWALGFLAGLTRAAPDGMPPRGTENVPSDYTLPEYLHTHAAQAAE
jgi:succinoglycan biosynthesis protein ExoA